MKKILVIISMGVLLSGCGHFFHKYEPPVVIVAPTPHVHAPKVDPIKSTPIKWNIYNTADLIVLIENSKKTGEEITLFALDEINFKLLNYNLADIKRYIEQQKAAMFLLDKAANASADAADAAAVKDGKK